MIGDVILVRHRILIGLKRADADGPSRFDSLGHTLFKGPELRQPVSYITGEHH
jgi:hypothetical protein